MKPKAWYEEYTGYLLVDQEIEDISYERRDDGLYFVCYFARKSTAKIIAKALGWSYEGVKR